MLCPLILHLETCSTRAVMKSCQQVEKEPHRVYFPRRLRALYTFGVVFCIPGTETTHNPCGQQRSWAVSVGTHLLQQRHNLHKAVSFFLPLVAIPHYVNESVECIPWQTPHYKEKVGCTRVYIIFFYISAPKHRFRALFRTASLRWL